MDKQQVKKIIEEFKRYNMIYQDGNLSVGGSLYLRGTGITVLPDNLSVGGSLDLEGTGITVLPDNLSVGGSLYLSGTGITVLPDNLSVGGFLDLSGTGITNYPVVYDCGNEKRAIYIKKEDPEIIRIGCFSGTKKQAIKAVNSKYKGNEAKEYIIKINECFAKASDYFTDKKQDSKRREEWINNK